MVVFVYFILNLFGIVLILNSYKFEEP